jgi:hypothetical protein
MLPLMVEANVGDLGGALCCAFQVVRHLLCRQPLFFSGGGQLMRKP